MLGRARRLTDGQRLLWNGPASGASLMPGSSPGSSPDTSTGSSPGSSLCYYRSLPSTNGLLRSMAADGVSPGTVVIAGEQTAGRGRHGRSWFSPPGGGRYCSLLLESGIAPERLGWITLAAALALVRSARPLGARLQIKWPNDLECNGRKVAGVLAEMVSQQGVVSGIVLGTGVNIDWSRCDVPKEVRERGGTLSDCADDVVDGDRFIADYLWEVRHLAAEIETPRNDENGEGSPPAFASEVMAHMGYLGERISVRTAGRKISGICTGLTSEGFLELDGGRSVVVGELITHEENGGDGC